MHDNASQIHYIATFFSHFGAMRFKKNCDSRQIPARLMPVPRSLSSSCGTCVSFQSSDLFPKADENLQEELEQIVECTETGYTIRYRAKDS